ncbi:unnamed protein product, partial [Rotaria sp. Silwood1]
SDSSGQIFTPTLKVFIQAALLRLSGCEANIQSDYGAVIEKDDYMIVKIQTFEPENIAYHIDFYLVDETTPLRKHIVDVLLITSLEGVQQNFLVSTSKYWRQ